MKKILFLVAATLVFPLTAYAGKEFTINPGALGGIQPAAFQADILTGNGSSFGLASSSGPVAVGVAWVNLTSAADKGTALFAGQSGLNSTYQLWAESSYTVQLDSGTFGQPGSSYHFVSLHTDFWADPTVATPTTFIPSDALGNPSVVLHGADAVKLGSLDLDDGTSSFSEKGGFASLADSSINLNATGQAFFGNTFNGQAALAFINPSSNTTFGSNFISGQAGAGAISLTSPVPEPSQLAMMLAGMLAVGTIAARRRKSQY